MMDLNQLMDHVPMWVFFIGMAAVAMASLEAGHRLGGRRRRAEKHENENPVGTVVAATVGLLGFMVALTLGSASARLDARKDAMIDSVNAIESAYLVAGLVPEPHRTETRTLLREYITLRIEMPKAFRNPEELARLDVKARALQDSLWSHAEALAAVDRSSEVYSLYTSSLNEIFRVYNRGNILGSQHRIPLLVWAVLALVTVIAMISVGFQFGLSGNRSIIADLTLALTFALVMSVIFDLDQPEKGMIGVSERPMMELSERMQTPN
jgi:hypothetical protein